MPSCTILGTVFLYMCYYAYDSIIYTCESGIIYKRLHKLLQLTDLPNLALFWYGIHCISMHAGQEERCVLQRSMKYLQQQTCIKFIEIEPPYEVCSPYVHFISTTMNR